MTEEEAHALWTLRSKWLGLYQISLVRGVWCARRYRGQPEPLTADAASELGQKIQAHRDSVSAGRPV